MKSILAKQRKIGGRRWQEGRGDKRAVRRREVDLLGRLVEVERGGDQLVSLLCPGHQVLPPAPHSQRCNKLCLKILNTKKEVLKYRIKIFAESQGATTIYCRLWELSY
jgi:hypothetical protein